MFSEGIARDRAWSPVFSGSTQIYLRIEIKFKIFMVGW